MRHLVGLHLSLLVYFKTKNKKLLYVLLFTIYIYYYMVKIMLEGTEIHWASPYSTNKCHCTYTDDPKKNVLYYEYYFQKFSIHKTQIYHVSLGLRDGRHSVRHFNTPTRQVPSSQKIKGKKLYSLYITNLHPYIIYNEIQSIQ